ncbi:hypothetical protein SAMN05216537_11816 [Lachnospira multipara]|uniref:Uncharacterized protein n=1 Tax=Lachnospira multipara TaxID=28051 RepID=A0A1H5WTV7_9FIRM|nr:hypothetical protein SAMN05216537_11816 [Lachnospira multipara]
MICFKIGEEQAPEFIDILNKNHISLEEKEELFNVYEYLKWNK